uniref:Bromo adjacent homology domain-containing 1 protein-like n=1 Tax=Saccoglossus kowalevskii TaxID=10224 RepID=A0ABM0M660_SACKO|nr:PREDICTED: bromo adjacent homology domain-containing 1 protein-like [Saccoglossus kowalevskii]
MGSTIIHFQFVPFFGADEQKEFGVDLEGSHSERGDSYSEWKEVTVNGKSHSEEGGLVTGGKSRCEKGSTLSPLVLFCHSQYQKRLLQSSTKRCRKKRNLKNNFLKVKQRLKTTVPPPSLKPKIRKKSTNGWQGIGEQFQKSVFLQNDAPSVVRNCYSAMKRKGGDIINVLDCILLKSGPRKIDLPYIAKVAAIWDDPEEGELMVSILWYYRPEHIEGGRKPHHHEVELFASKHKDHNSVATIEDRCYVLTLAEYNRHCRVVKMTAEGIKNGIPLVPLAEEYPRKDRLPSEYIDKELTYFCRHVYDYKLKRILKNPS